MGVWEFLPGNAQQCIIPHFSPVDNALEVKKVKFSKGSLAAICLTAGALCAGAGWLLHDLMGADSYRVSGEHPFRQPTAYTQNFTPDEPIDLNTATLAQLMGLPGIGQTRAQAILDYREANGPFTYPEDIIAVDGIGQIIYEDIAEYITTS